MDNAQITARDLSWFLFADWQGMTRIALPGDKVKTDANLDRPNETKPLVLRPEGLVWSTYGTDIDPVALKKLSATDRCTKSPDPLGGPQIDVAYDGHTVTVRETVVTLDPNGAEVQLGGLDGRRKKYASNDYNIAADGAVVTFGTVAGQTRVGLVARNEDGAGRAAWCYPIAMLPNGAPDVFREGYRTWLTDRDIAKNLAFLLEFLDDGAVAAEGRCVAVAGPWVLDGRVWWQPDEATVCVGDQLGQPTQRFTLTGDDQGPGRLLRLSGRKLFLLWEGTTILDLEPAKKGKERISRKHKATDAPMYLEAERLLRPITTVMARRGVRVGWRGCTRSSRYIELKGDITGQSSLITELLSSSLRNGGPARLSSLGVTSVSASGGGYDQIFAPGSFVSREDLAEFVAMLDTVGLSRANLAHLWSLQGIADQRGLTMPLGPGAELFALSAVLSGLRFESSGEIPTATAADCAACAKVIGDWERLHKVGIVQSTTAFYVTFSGHRQFGPEAVAPVREVLKRLNPTFDQEVAKSLGQPFVPYVSPVYEEPALTEAESLAVAQIETALVGLGLDLATCREGKRWYRFTIDGDDLQCGLHDDVRVQATLCATATDLDLRALGSELRKANKKLSGAQFLEQDCYLHARIACPWAEATSTKVRGMIQACQAALASEEATALRVKYKSWD